MWVDTCQCEVDYRDLQYVSDLLKLFKKDKSTHSCTTLGYPSCVHLPCIPGGEELSFPV